MTDYATLLRNKRIRDGNPIWFSDNYYVVRTTGRPLVVPCADACGEMLVVQPHYHGDDSQ